MKNSVVKQNPILIGALSGMFRCNLLLYKNFEACLFIQALVLFYNLFCCTSDLFSFMWLSIQFSSSFKYDQLKQNWGPFSQFYIVYFSVQINFLNFWRDLRSDFFFLVSFWEGLYLAMGLRHTLSNFFFSISFDHLCVI